MIMLILKWRHVFYSIQRFNLYLDKNLALFLWLKACVWSSKKEEEEKSVYETFKEQKK